MTDAALGARHRRVTRLRRLVGKPAARDAERCFVAEGARAVQAALDAGAEAEALYVDRGVAVSRETGEVIERARRQGIRIIGLQPGVIERVADTVTPQPVLGVFSYLDRPLADLRPGAVLVLADVRDPGNVGAIIRSADAAGVDGLVLCDGCCDLYNPKVVRASAGSLFHLPIARGPEPLDVLDRLATRGFDLVATVARAGEDYALADLAPPVAIVFGNEAHGLSAAVEARCGRALTVPIAGGAESLNVAMAATAIVFELARRRRQGASALSMRP